MRKLAAQIARWIVKYFISFLIIISVLYLGEYLKNQYSALKAKQAEIATLQSAMPEIDSYLKALKNEGLRRTQAIDKFAINELTKRIDSIDSEIALKSALNSNVENYFTTPVSAGFVDRYKRDLEIDLLKQEREYLVKLKSIASARLGIDAGKMELERRRLVYVALRKLVDEKMTELELARKNSLFYFKKYLVTPKVRTLSEEYSDLVDKYNAAVREYEDQKKVLELQSQALSISENASKYFEINNERIKIILAPLHTRIDEITKSVSDHWITKVSNPAISKYQAAFIILISAILTPIGIKIFFYYFLAPLAAKRPPICILPSVTGVLGRHTPDSEEILDQTRISAVSIKLTVDSTQELLLHPEYLQSSSLHGKSDTKWLLDWSCPLSSFASGMVALTRIRSDSNETVVVSATKDPFSEVALLTLTEGDGMVFQPRSLIGVLYQKGLPVKISRHWRLGSLHAWLTLQLRYLVFHGPAILIVKGCRGVRLEKAGSGRRINQAATMGFSANLHYSTSRSETFVPYLFGEQELFVDSFTGNSGIYVYEEMPNYGKKSGITGKGFEGLTDSLLKVFGI